MSISQEVITEILDRAQVEDRFRTDPELLAAAYAIAFIDEPVTGPEGRLYESDVTLYGDNAPDNDPADGPDTYTMPTAAMLKEIYGYRISIRSRDLEWGNTDELEEEEARREG